MSQEWNSYKTPAFDFLEELKPYTLTAAYPDEDVCFEDRINPPDCVVDEIVDAENQRKVLRALGAEHHAQNGKRSGNLRHKERVLLTRIYQSDLLWPAFLVSCNEGMSTRGPEG